MTDGQNQFDDVLTSHEVAKMLKVCVVTVRKLVREERLRAIAGLRQLRFTRAAVEAFLRGEDSDAHGRAA